MTADPIPRKEISAETDNKEDSGHDNKNVFAKEKTHPENHFGEKRRLNRGVCKDSANLRQSECREKSKYNKRKN